MNFKGGVEGVVCVCQHVYVTVCVCVCWGGKGGGARVVKATEVEKH